MRSWEAGQDLLRAWESKGPNTALISVEDAVERFLEDVEARHLAEATVAKQKILLSRLVAFADEIGVKYISQLTGESMVKFRAGWTDSPISALKKLERLRSFFRFCTGMKWVEENPIGTLKAPKFHPNPTLPFTGEEFEKILAAVEKYPTKNSFGSRSRKPSIEGRLASRPSLLCTRGRFTLTRRPPSVSSVRVLPQYWCVRSA
jgi:hypothetical protein